MFYCFRNHLVELVNTGGISQQGLELKVWTEFSDSKRFVMDGRRQTRKPD
jgi:hypothetical protein